MSKCLLESTNILPDLLLSQVSCTVYRATTVGCLNTKKLGRHKIFAVTSVKESFTCSADIKNAASVLDLNVS